MDGMFCIFCIVYLHGVAVMRLNFTLINGWYVLHSIRM